ncbi:RNA pol II transcription cofactor [Mucor velutinosus]|uniref:RNA pol II transcription cofactor n=1 Tax=Mucor velutinosus TaxID=708070 RepID=A0AAN7HSI7_9FUNG|nr:RNA pol II transcription cofactor [Mucor velutinosus]
METILCLQWKQSASLGRLGCCYYSGTNLELQLMEDTVESDKFEYTSMLLAQLSPQTIILPDPSDENLVEFLTSEHGATATLIRTSNKEFLFDKGRITLLNWYISHINQQQEQQPSANTAIYTDTEDTGIENHHIYFRDHEEGIKTHAYLQMEGLIELEESQLTIGCAGVLLKHLDKLQQERNMQEDETGVGPEVVQPTVIKAFSCNRYMQVNSDTMRSLCIFESERHPNMHQIQKKEILSLFGLLNKTTSVLGKEMLREWVSRPMTDKMALEDRHLAIGLFMASDMRDKSIALRSHLRHIKNIHRLLVRVRESKAKTNDWQYILKFAYYTICIFNALQPIFNSPYAQCLLIQKFKKRSSTVKAMQEAGSVIDSIIDFGASKAEAQTIVKKGVDNELDMLREEYEKLNDTLLRVSQEIGSALPIGLSAALNVVYFPQLGYLITLPQYHLQRNSGLSSASSSYCDNSNVTEYYQRNLPGFELQFSTADNLYYKNDRTKELDATLGDLHAMISDREIEILQELSTTVLQYSTQFIEISEALSELDCYVKPNLTMDNSLDVVKGRHPLQELSVGIFIPNHTHLKGGQGFKSQRPDVQYSSAFDSLRDTASSRLNSAGRDRRMGDDTNSIQIVTGANFSGKSVYLKQVALLTYMAHVGSFVPAERATIGITDKLFTRIQTSETVLKPQSAFAFDLQQINRALQNATCQSLVIIDEFGKGTDIADGSALFCSALGYFLSKGDQCPKVIASTHFHDLVCKNILSVQDGITLSQTEIMSQNMQNQDNNKEGLHLELVPGKESEVVFLYRIVPSNGDSKSHGLWCASIAGFPAHTIERAAYLTRKFKNMEPIEKIQTEQEEEKYRLLEIIRDDFVTKNISDQDISQLIPSINSIFI